MENKTHWKKLTNPDYLGSYDFQPKEERVVKILSVKREMVTGPENRKEECTVAVLENSKPIILNKTNCKTITKVHGTPYIEDWKDIHITLYVSQVKAFGEVVDALRVKPTKPNIAQPDYSAQIARLRACKTLDELKNAYLALSKTEQAALVTEKDNMKTKLSE